MKKLNLGIIGIGVLVLCMIGLAWAASPHYLSGPSASIDSDGDLVINFRESGLGNVSDVTYELIADVDALYQCVNKGNNCPQAANKQEVQSKFDQKFTLPAHNGNTSGPIIAPPPPVTDFCPGKQFPALQSITWSNIVLIDPIGTQTPLGTISRTFFVCP